MRRWMRCAVVFAALFLAAAPAALAETTVIEIQAYIDGRDLLILQANTLQWHHLDWDAVGRTDGGNEPTIISTWLDGAPVMASVEWYPEWSAPPPDLISNEEFSSVFESLSPALWTSDMDVALEVLSGREVLQILEMPTAANAYTLVLDFDDNAPGGAEWYHARLTITPEPATLALVALGGLGVLLRRRRK